MFNQKTKIMDSRDDNNPANQPTEAFNYDLYNDMKTDLDTIKSNVSRSSGEVDVQIYEFIEKLLTLTNKI
jgi:hypothetical protein